MYLQVPKAAAFVPSKLDKACIVLQLNVTSPIPLRQQNVKEEQIKEAFEAREMIWKSPHKTS